MCTRVCAYARDSAYQTLSSEELSYLFSVLSLEPMSKVLRSSGYQLLSVSWINTYAGTRAFPVVAASLWN